MGDCEGKTWNKAKEIQTTSKKGFIYDLFNVGDVVILGYVNPEHCSCYQGEASRYYTHRTIAAV
ncbi:hypothetical protein ACJIZ3_009361 [Penstemon smallii]|uniref:Uncharacterized protein n=1 Tax=Penstemon smallii TaxID=265156 RepID=A0ABD3TDR3_9LAMI